MDIPHYAVAPPAHLHHAGLDLWGASRRDMYDVSPLTDEPDDCFFQTSAYRVNSLVFSKSRCRKIFLSRRKRHLDSNVSGFAYFFFARGAQYLSAANGEQKQTTADKLTVVDFAHSVEFALLDCSQIAVFVPHEMIGGRPGHVTGQASFSLDSTAVRILYHALTATLNELPRAARDDAELIASGFAGLLRGLLSGDAMSQSETKYQDARARSMRSYIEQNLRDPALNAAKLEQVFGASKATIFRDFAEYGGVGRYIKTRRLERAFSDLADTEDGRGAVTTIAERWGFETVSHLSRGFREHFGHTPSSAVGLRAHSINCGTGYKVGTAIDLEGVHGDPYSFEHWLADIGSNSRSA